jgi:hypothetical protein
MYQTFGKKIFVGILNASEEKNRIRIRNRFAQIRGSKSVRNVTDPETLYTHIIDIKPGRL